MPTNSQITDADLSSVVEIIELPSDDLGDFAALSMCVGIKLPTK